MLELTNISMILAAEEVAEETSLLSPNQMAGYTVTAISAIITVIVSYIIIKKFVFKPIMNIINKRQEVLNEELDKATKAAEEADTNIAESKNIISESHVKANEILEEARANAAKQSAVIIKKANDDAAVIVSQAQEDAKRIKKVALEEMQDDLSDLAVEIAKRILGDAVSDSTMVELSKKHTKEVVEDEVKKLG